MRRFLLASLLATATTAASAAPVTYELDPRHTMVLASWNHFGYSNPVAGFSQVDGTLVYDREDVAASTVEVTLPLAGLHSFVPVFDEHLRGADFFDAAAHPEVRFRSTSVAPAGERRLKVAGDLTIKGITRPVVLDVTLNDDAPHPMSKRATVGFDATTTIRRSEFGMGKLVPRVSDEVVLRITTEAMAAAAPPAA